MLKIKRLTLEEVRVNAPLLYSQIMCDFKVRGGGKINNNFIRSRIPQFIEELGLEEHFNTESDRLRKKLKARFDPEILACVILNSYYKKWQN